MSKRKNRQFERAQVAVEVLVTVGIFVIGAVIFGAYYIASHNKQTANVPDPNLFRDLNYVDVNYADIPEVCGNGICRAGETGCSCERDCGYTPCCDILHPEGNGSEFSPREICDENQLFHITDMNLSWSYILGVDINLTNEFLQCSGTSEHSSVINEYLCGDGWLPIGQVLSNSSDTNSDHQYVPGQSDCNAFTGIFNGNGHTIYGLRLDAESGSDFQGLFCKMQGVNSKIENLNFNGVDILQGKDHVGTLVGENYMGTISNIHVINANFIISQTKIVGGIVGYIENGILEKSSFVGQMSSSHNTGGLVGKSIASNILNNYSRATVNAGNYKGGLIGCSESSNISNNYSVGQVIGGGSPNDCFIGEKCQGVITLGTIISSYYDRNVCNISGSVGTPKYTYEMKDLSHPNYIYQDWNFTTIWIHDGAGNSGYPFLR